MEWWKLLIHFSLEKLNYLKNASLFSHFEHDFESECNSHGQSKMVMAGTLLPKVIGYVNASVNNGKLRVTGVSTTFASTAGRSATYHPVNQQTQTQFAPNSSELSRSIHNGGTKRNKNIHLPAYFLTLQTKKGLQKCFILSTGKMIKQCSFPFIMVSLHKSQLQSQRKEKVLKEPK